MKKIQYILAFLGLFLLASCLPEADTNGNMLHGLGTSGSGSGSGGGSGTGGTTGTNTLVKVTMPDNNGGTYDENFNWVSGKLSSVTTSNNSFNVVITYSGAKISKIVKTINNPGVPAQIETMNLVYSGSTLTKITGDMSSSGMVILNETVDYSYDSNGNPTKIKFVGIDPSGISNLTITSDMQYSGLNLSQWNITTDLSAGPISIPPTYINATLSNYDAYKNPFKTLPVEYNLAIAYTDFSGFGITPFSANNFQKATIKTDVDSQTGTCTYTYNSAGYPIKATSSTGDVVTFSYN